MMRTALTLSALFLLILAACRKNGLGGTSDGSLRISADTLHFDTLFSSTGSVSQVFKLFNDNNQPLQIDQLSLAGGGASAFNINADGFPGPEVSSRQTGANDSLYVFVTVTIDPTQNDLPFVVRDSIGLSYNGKQEWVQLEAWGQNANFYRDHEVMNDETWTNTRPYVILGSLYIEQGATLRIEKGCRIFVHADAPVLVAGTLQVLGESDSSSRVYFSGDRLDDPYRNFPGSWPGIYFSATSEDNYFRYAVLRNAYQALVVQEPAANGQPKLRLESSIIENAYDAGLLAIHSGVDAANCLISNCGKNLMLIQGGSYDFNHCTIASYGNIYLEHKDPVLLLANYITQNNIAYPENLTARFRNSIFWGDNGTVDDEVVTSRVGSNPYSVEFDHVLWKVQTVPEDVTLNAILQNDPPLFDSTDSYNRIFDFHLQEGSPALNAGTASALTGVLDGKARPNGIPDLGCYEKQ